jgi:16S rRNA (uracil1498-N3)-methyltransferase
MDLIVRKSTELGVSRIIPVVTERSQVRHTQKTERWRKIARSASQQSGRSIIPEIEEAVDFSRYIERFMPDHAMGYVEDIKGVRLDSGYRIILSERRMEANLKKLLSGMSGTKSLTLLVGPEGGFTEEEIFLAKEHGFVEASLGPRILRTETAPLAALSIIQYELGDIGVKSPVTPTR